MVVRSTFLILFCAQVLPAFAAQDLVCPDLSAAVQVGTCPTEQELQYTFVGYCSDNARLYGGESEVCTNYQNYRRLKNVVLWESADGDFSGYVSCDQAVSGLRELRATKIKLATQGGLNRLTCSYGDGVAFTHRTRASCVVDGSGDCGTDSTACKASCR